MSRQQWMAAWICLVMPCVPLLAQGGISGNGAANGAGIRDGVRNGGKGTGTGDGTGPSENGTRNGTVDDNGDGNGNGGGAPGDGATLSGTTFDVSLFEGCRWFFPVETNSATFEFAAADDESAAILTGEASVTLGNDTAEPSSSLAGQWCGLDLGSATLWLLSVTDQSDQLLAFGLQFDANLIGRATGAGTLSGQFQLFGQAAVGSEDDGPGGPPGEDPTGEGPDDGPGDNPEDIPGHDPPDQDPPGQVPPGQIPPGQGSSDQGGQNPTNQPSQVGRAGSANQSANGQTGGPDVRRFRSNRITTP